jgi:hypothetical protein
LGRDFVSLGSSRQCGFVARNGRTALRFIGSLAMILFFFSDPPADGELQEKVRLNFVQNRYHSQPVNIIILSGERLTDDINITQ